MPGTAEQATILHVSVDGMPAYGELRGPDAVRAAVDQARTGGEALAIRADADLDGATLARSC